MPRPVVVVAIVIAALARIAGAGIGWQPSLEAALEDAKTRHVPVFIAVNMDGERANDEMVNVHYKDPHIIELAAKCSSLFASVDDHGGDKPCKRCGGPVTCTQHRALEKKVRVQYLKNAGSGYVAPEHLFLDPEGKVLLSVPYRVSLGELEWCFVAALKTVDPAFEWKLADGAKPPHRLVNGGVAENAGEGTQKAPTKKEVDEILAELAKAKKIFDKLDLVARLLRSPEKKALDFFENLLSGKLPNREDGLLELLRNFGRFSPPEYAPLVVPFLDDERPKIKSQAIVTLELLANPKALAPLNKQWKKDHDPKFRKDLIRAIAACGPDDAATEKLVMTEIESEAEPIVRVSAMLAAEHLGDHKKVMQAANAALAQTEIAELRFAAGWVMASFRDESQLATLETAAAGEKDERVKEALDACVGVYGGKPLTSLDPYVRDLCGSDIPRDRL